MGYRTLRQCLDDLAATRQLVRIDEEIDANLEAAEVHRRVNQARGPALLFTRVKNCPFPMASNLFGTIERARYIFRDSLDSVRRLIEAKIDPPSAWKNPAGWLDLGRTAWSLFPKRVSSAPVVVNETKINFLPQLKCWPNDGGAFITLPLVYTEDPDCPGWRHSNLGMYRVQISGGQYQPNTEVGLHYQIHRGIGVHHAAAARRGEPLRVNIFVGGAPAMTLAAVMPLPERMSELAFAGALARHRIPLIRDAPSGRPSKGSGRNIFADLRRSRFLHHRHRRDSIVCSPRARLAIIWVITALRTITLWCESKEFIIAATRFGRLQLSAIRHRKTPCSAN